MVYKELLKNSPILVKLVTFWRDFLANFHKIQNNPSPYDVIRLRVEASVEFGY